jgi:hypothetical protein
VVVPAQAEHLGQRVHLGNRQLGQQTGREAKGRTPLGYHHCIFSGRRNTTKHHFERSTASFYVLITVFYRVCQ